MKVKKAVLLTATLTLFATLVVLNLSTGEKNIEQPIASLYGVEDPQFARSMGSLLGPPLLDGNRAVELLNGDQIFPSMLEAIRSARHTICFETYIYWSGVVGRQFSEALSERARAGVKVHLLVDWVGSGKMEEALIEQMTGAGVQLEKFHPLRWYYLQRMNNRTHRKILVVDGAVGFTGGVGVADHWRGNAQTPEQWRDSHFRLEGPAVAQMQAAFLDNWTKARGQVLHGPEYFPPLAPAGSALGQVFKSSPQEGSESMRLMYLLSIAAARRSLYISNSYFLPDDLCVQALVAARRRGVDVQLIVPGPLTDTEITRKASRARWGPLLEAGVQIWEYMPTMYHCKVMVVDEQWVSVGSTNFDNRSFRLNDEANLNVLEPAFARRQLEVFFQDRSQSRAVTLEQWKRRPWREKLVERAAALLRSQL